MNTATEGLQVTKLTKTYPGGIRALDAVDLTVAPGLYGLLGPNGAGKSTLMRTLATLQQPDSGSITLDGVDTLGRPRLRAPAAGLPAAAHRHLPHRHRTPAPRSIRLAEGPDGQGRAPPRGRAAPRARESPRGRGSRRRHLLRGHAAPVRHRARPGRQSAPAHRRRADGRPRPGGAEPLPPGAGGHRGRQHRAAVDAHRRRRREPLRAAVHPRRRAHRRRGNAGRPDRARSKAASGRAWCPAASPCPTMRCMFRRRRRVRGSSSRPRPRRATPGPRRRRASRTCTTTRPSRAPACRAKRRWRDTRRRWRDDAAFRCRRGVARVPGRLPGPAHPHRVPGDHRLRDAGADERGVPARMGFDRRPAQQSATGLPDDIGAGDVGAFRLGLALRADRRARPERETARGGAGGAGLAAGVARGPLPGRGGGRLRARVVDGARVPAGPPVRRPRRGPRRHGGAAALVRDGPRAAPFRRSFDLRPRRAAPVRRDPGAGHGRAVRGRGGVDAGLDGGDSGVAGRRCEPRGGDAARRLGILRGRGADRPLDAAGEEDGRHRADDAARRQPGDLDGPAAAAAGSRVAAARPRTPGAGTGPRGVETGSRRHRPGGRARPFGRPARHPRPAVLGAGHVGRSGLAFLAGLPGMGHPARRWADRRHGRRQLLRPYRHARRRPPGPAARSDPAPAGRDVLPGARLHRGRLRRGHGAPGRPPGLRRDRRCDACAARDPRGGEVAGGGGAHRRLHPDPRRHRLDRAGSRDSRSPSACWTRWSTSASPSRPPCSSCAPWSCWPTRCCAMRGPRTPSR